MSEIVIAVLLTRGGSSSLPETVASLGLQSRPVDSLVVVNRGDAESGQYVRSITGNVPILNIPDEASLSPAITELIRQGGQNRQTREPVWIWFVVDGAVPKHDALSNTMAVIEKSPSARVAGAKQKGVRNILLDVGLTTSRWVKPVTLIDDGESDQGQHDDRSDVLGVSLSGMLVAQRKWEQLKGFDPDLPSEYQSLDFCWRVRVSGDRVVVVPQAVVYHHGGADKTDRHVRPETEGDTSPLYDEDGTDAFPLRMSLNQVRNRRYTEAYLRLKNASAFAFLFLYIGLVLSSSLRFLGSLVLKNFAIGWHRFCGAMAVALRPRRIFRARSEVNEIRCVSRSVIKGLQATNRDMWEHRRDYPAAATVEKNMEEEHPTGETIVEAPHDALPQVRANFGFPLVVVVSLALSLGNVVSFYGSSAIGGGASLPVSKNLSELLSNGTGWWVEAGSGFASYAHPFSLILGLFGLLGLGNANIAIIIFFMLSGPIAAMGMWFLSGALTRRYFIRCCAAILWAIAPIHGTIVAQGRLNSLAVFVLAPWVALALLRAVGGSRKNPYGDVVENTRATNGSDGRISWTAAAAGGLGLAVMTACVPSLLPIAVIVVVISAVALGKRGISLWWAIIPSLTLFLPYLWSSRWQPRAIFADPGAPVSVPPVPLWQQMLGFADRFKPSSGVMGFEFLTEKLPRVPWAFVVATFTTAPIVVLAVASVIFYGRRLGFVRVLWGGILILLAASGVSSMVVVAVDESAVVTPWSGNFVVITYLLLMCAAIIGADGMGRRKNFQEHEKESRRKVFFVPVSLMLISCFVGGAVFFVQQFVAPTDFSQQQDSVPKENPTLGEGSAKDTTAGTENRPEKVKVSDTIPTTETEQLGSIRWAQRVSDNSVPVTAADFGNSDLRTKTLVINAAEKRPVTAVLMRGSGNTLDTVNPVATASFIRKDDAGAVSLAYDGVDSMTRNTVAALVSGNGAGIADRLRVLGVGFVVLRNHSDAAQPIVQAIEASSELNSVGATSYGWLWQVKGLASTHDEARGKNNGTTGNGKEPPAYIRFVDAEGGTVGVVPAIKGGADAEVTVPENAVKIVMAERYSPLWKASFENQKLPAGSFGEGFQEFNIGRHDKGRLSIEIDEPRDWIVKSVIGVVFIITLLLAIPIRTTVVGGSRKRSALPEKVVGGEINGR